MEAKPILVVRVYVHTWEYFYDHTRRLANMMPDYHVLFVPKPEGEIVFEVHNPKDATDESIEAFKLSVIAEYEQYIKHGSPA